MSLLSLGLVKMSVSGGVMILMILLIRTCLLGRLPKRAFVALWMLAMLRLLVPFAVPSTLSAYTAVEHLLGGGMPPAISAPVRRLALDALPLAGRSFSGAGVTGTGMLRTAPSENDVSGIGVSGIPVGGGWLPSREAGAAHAPEADIHSNMSLAPQDVFTFSDRPELGEIMAWAARNPLLCAYLLGLVLALCYLLAVYCILLRRIRRARPACGPAQAFVDAQPLRRRVRVVTCAALRSPATFGLARPVILLPEGLPDDQQKLEYVLRHELVHIRRFDVALKTLLALTLAVHWFNPLVWAMMLLAARDIELACDEAVMGPMDADARADYARLLLGMQSPGWSLTPLGSGFSRHSISERIVAIMKYERRAFSMVAVSCLLILCMGWMFLTAAKVDGAAEMTDVAEVTPIPGSEAPDEPAMNDMPEVTPYPGSEAPVESTMNDVAGVTPYPGSETPDESAMNDVADVTPYPGAEATDESEWYALETGVDLAVANQLPDKVVELMNQDYKSMSIARFESQVSQTFSGNDSLHVNSVFNITFDDPEQEAFVIGPFRRAVAATLVSFTGVDNPHNPGDPPGEPFYAEPLRAITEGGLDWAMVRCLISYEIPDKHALTVGELDSRISQYKDALGDYIADMDADTFVKGDLRAQLSAKRDQLAQRFSTDTVRLRAINFGAEYTKDGKAYTLPRNFMDNTEFPPYQQAIPAEQVALMEGERFPGLYLGFNMGTADWCVSPDGGETWYANGYRDPESGVRYRFDGENAYLSISPDDGKSWWKQVRETAFEISAADYIEHQTIFYNKDGKDWSIMMGSSMDSDYIRPYMPGPLYPVERQFTIPYPENLEVMERVLDLAESRGVKIASREYTKMDIPLDGIDKPLTNYSYNPSPGIYQFTMYDSDRFGCYCWNVDEENEYTMQDARILFIAMVEILEGYPTQQAELLVDSIIDDHAEGERNASGHRFNYEVLSRREIQWIRFTVRPPQTNT